MSNAAAVTLTPFEIAVLKDGIIGNDFYIESGWAWTNTVADYCQTVTPAQFRGVLTSLLKKGMIEKDGNEGRDACVRPSARGLETIKSL